VGEEQTDTVISYFKGSPDRWHAGIHTYRRIVYRDLWPGIDLAFYGDVHQLKYEFIVHPGADPAQIRLAYQGAEEVVLDGEGRLEVRTPLGGSNWDEGYAIAVDGSGNAYVTGETKSSDFPTTPGAYDTTHNGAWDAFVAKMGMEGKPNCIYLPLILRSSR